MGAQHFDKHSGLKMWGTNLPVTEWHIPEKWRLNYTAENV